MSQPHIATGIPSHTPHWTRITSGENAPAESPGQQLRFRGTWCSTVVSSFFFPFFSLRWCLAFCLHAIYPLYFTRSTLAELLPSPPCSSWTGPKGVLFAPSQSAWSYRQAAPRAPLAAFAQQCERFGRSWNCRPRNSNRHFRERWQHTLAPETRKGACDFFSRTFAKRQWRHYLFDKLDIWLELEITVLYFNICDIWVDPMVGPMDATSLANHVTLLWGILFMSHEWPVGHVSRGASTYIWWYY